MPKYLTWEKVRSRWIFQIRIPEQVRPAFGGKTTIRQHLGNISEAEAVARAAQLAAHYKQLFDQHLAQTKPHKRSDPYKAGAVKIVLDENISQRFVDTWHTREAHAFADRLESLRDACDSEWDDLEQEIDKSLSDARICLRRADTQAMQQALVSIQSDLNVKIDCTRSAMDTLTHAFNGARVAYLTQCLAIARGEASISSLNLAPETQLPLVELWGYPASRLAERWKEMVLSVGGEVELKTLEKYRGIADDLETVLTRRPVQCLTETDVEALKALWVARDNGAGTIKDKLRILQSMLRPFDSDGKLEETVARRLPRTCPPRAVRLPFTVTQARRLMNELFNNPSIREDDQMLIALLLLLGARIEEIYQLSCNDFTPTSTGWLVRFADRHQTGSGEASLKNAVSARRLPLRSGVLPELDAWIRERLGDKGYLFPNGSSNKYGIRSAAASRRLNRLIRDLFSDDRRLVLQSTRPTANRAMRRANTDPRIRRRFLGHADIDVHERHYDPGELLDDRDLLPGSTALADFLLEALGRRKRAGATRSKKHH